MGVSIQKGRDLRDVLVVDDDLELAELIGDELKREGYRVRLAYSGDQALAQIEAQPPDIAILDLLMPGMGGDELCARIRENPALEGTRVLVLSGLPDTRVVAANCDADGAVVKPFTLDLLKHEVRRLAGA